MNSFSSHSAWIQSKIKWKPETHANPSTQQHMRGSCQCYCCPGQQNKDVVVLITHSSSQFQMPTRRGPSAACCCPTYFGNTLASLLLPVQTCIAPTRALSLHTIAFPCKVFNKYLIGVTFSCKTHTRLIVFAMNGTY